MSPDNLRYSCQIALPGFNESAQEKLTHAAVLIVGAGGLGCPAAQYLVAAGVGKLAIADDDNISISNLHRQILFNQAETGLSKSTTAVNKLRQQNPLVQVVDINERITHRNAVDIISQYDVVIDCTDNFDSRYLINDAAVILGKPVIYGAIYQFEGQVAIWNVKNDDGTFSPNYRDVYPDVNAAMVPNCAEGGVIPTLAGIIGCLQANEAIKLITGVGTALVSRILMINAADLSNRTIRLAKQSHVVITSLPDSDHIPVISVEALKEKLAAHDVSLIDVRTEEERNLYHIGGIHVPLSGLHEHLSLFHNGKQFVIYCASGKRSAEAVKMIRKAVADAEIVSLKGGLKAWMDQSVQG
jgi:adenylyltransferase/sulfurtransferase